jgi:tRNA (guanine37-N1)-methyltransferase
MRSLCVAVPLKMGEEVRRTLLEKGRLRNDLILEKDEGFLYLPILDERKVDEELGYQIMERDFQVLERETRSYRELLELPDDLMELLPSSFDVIGYIAIIKFPDELQEHKKAIGEALLSANKTLKTVATDLGVEGEERIRNLRIIAGEENTETIHREHGTELITDPSKVYFSPRLATERYRISQMVGEGEIVLDMFCGVGPFSIIIAKSKDVEKVYAIDINEKAIEYLKKNIERNKAENVVPMQGDSKDIVPTLGMVDRIIMNLPHSAFEFLSIAFSRIKSGGTIHYYEVLENDDKKKRFEEILGIVKDIRIELVNLQEVHTYSPSSSLYCFDMKVEFDEGDI